MSQIKVNKVTPRSGTTVTLGDGAGETVTVDAATVNLGRCGGTVALACGATSTGFGITGITWCTTAKTAAFCAAAGSGYLVNTTSTAFAATLPASPTVGDQIAFVDFAGTFDSNALTLGRNGKKIKAQCNCGEVTAERGAVTIIYTGTTQGWITTTQANSGTIGFPTYIIASGGTPATGAICGDYKIHTFTGTGPLCVSQIGNATGSSIVDYLVVAGGGGGGGPEGGGGGGAGGYRESVPSPAAWTASPIAAPAGGLTASVSDYTITVGGGGPLNPSPSGPQGVTGNNSVFSTITSYGGGGGGKYQVAGATGGSGGGGGGRSNYAGGAGNIPTQTPSQGFAGGASKAPGCNPDTGGGGGGALAIGTQGSTAPNPSGGGPGGAGGGTELNPSPSYGTPGPSAPLRYFAGGGGGGKDADSPNGSPAGVGGDGGGGRGSSADPATPCQTSTAAGVNTGGGGGGQGGGPQVGSAGGSGIVIVRYKFQ